MTIEHVAIADPDIHEPKGIAAASSGQLYEADGVGSGTWKSPKLIVQQAIYDYNDLTTASTPISLALADTQYELTNDGSGPNTNKTYAYSDISDLWNTSTDRFDFSSLSLGDTVDIRFDVEFTTSSANTAVDLDIELGIGASPYQLSLISKKSYKTSDTYQETIWYSVYMGDTVTKDNPARILALSDTTGVTVKVNGWYIRPLRNISLF